MEDVLQRDEFRATWMPQFVSYIVSRQYTQALRFLDRGIEKELPLLHELPCPRRSIVH